MLAALLVGLLVISYFLSGLTTLDGVTLANWQDKLLYVILHPLQNYEKVDRMFKKKELLQKENVQKEAIKKVVGQVPQKLPAMPRKGM